MIRSIKNRWRWREKRDFTEKVAEIECLISGPDGVIGRGIVGIGIEEPSSWATHCVIGVRWKRIGRCKSHLEKKKNGWDCYLCHHPFHGSCTEMKWERASRDYMYKWVSVVIYNRINEINDLMLTVGWRSFGDRDWMEIRRLLKDFMQGKRRNTNVYWLGCHMGGKLSWVAIWLFSHCSKWWQSCPLVWWGPTFDGRRWWMWMGP